MNILFITSSRLGDAVLSTGLLDHIIRTDRDARITLVCGPLPAPLFEGMPALDRIIPLSKRKYNLHWLELWLKICARPWDMVVDLRDSAVSRMVPASKRYIFSPRDIDRDMHKVEQAAAVMELDFVPPPRVWPGEGQKRLAAELVPDGGPVLGIGPTANWIGKTWPAENFIELVRILTAKDGILPDARLAVFAAEGEEEQARRVLVSVPEDRRIDVIAKADPGTVAAALGRCALYVGNDSGLMHCAAAVGIPTAGLFGPGWPQVYRPWGPNAIYVQTPESCEELTDFEGYDPKTLDRSLMTTLKTQDVVEAVSKFWKELRKAA